MYRVYETEMKWSRSNNSSPLRMGYSASSAPEQFARVQHGLEIRGLSQAQSIVVLRVEHFRFLAHCVFFVKGEELGFGQNAATGFQEVLVDRGLAYSIPPLIYASSRIKILPSGRKSSAICSFSQPCPIRLGYHNTYYPYGGRL